MSSKQSQYEKLHDLVTKDGGRLLLGADKGRLIQLSIERNNKRVRSVSMTFPRPLTVEQAASALLTSLS